MKNLLLGCACLSIMSLSSGFSCKTNGGLEPTTEITTADTQPKSKLISLSTTRILSGNGLSS
jgi:hypothetical protein